jgi:CHRD domain-containing protein
MRALPVGVLAALIPLLLMQAVRADGDAFKARLSSVPVESAAQARNAGAGSVTATLKGSSLTLQGTFEGLRSPATMAQIHLGPKGIRGPVMFDLTATKATSGTITGMLTLTPVQADALKQSRFYVQLHSEASPDGVLWGWLLP